MKRTALVLILVFFIAALAGAAEWYEGGTLHKSTLKEWHSATPQNRQATSSDFVYILIDKSYIPALLADNKALLKEMSDAMVKCMSSSKNNPSPSVSTAESAEACLFLISKGKGVKKR